jgi:hypothetical protein
VFMQNIINFPLNIEPYAPQMIRDAGRSVQLVFVEPARFQHPTGYRPQ